MNIVVYLAAGLIAGFIAGKIIEGHGFGIIGDMVVGMVGAFVGAVFYTSTRYHTANLVGATLTATLGAIILLVFVNLVNLTFMPRKKVATH